MITKSIKSILLFVILGFISLFFSSCSQLDSGTAISRYNFYEDLNSEENHIEITHAGGKLSIYASPNNSFNAKTETNHPDWTPKFNKTNGDFLLTQNELPEVVQKIDKNIINDWEIGIGQNPVTLRLNTLKNNGVYDFTDLHLNDLIIYDGLSDFELEFKSPNSGEIENLFIKSSSSTAYLGGLSNANFWHFKFEGVGGNYTLDFSGELQQNSTVDIISGLGYLQIIIPKNINTIIVLDGIIQRQNIEGDWINDKNIYFNKTSGNLLTINVEMDITTLELIKK